MTEPAPGRHRKPTTIVEKIPEPLAPVLAPVIAKVVPLVAKPEWAGTSEASHRNMEAHQRFEDNLSRLLTIAVAVMMFFTVAVFALLIR